MVNKLLLSSISTDIPSCCLQSLFHCADLLLAFSGDSADLGFVIGALLLGKCQFLLQLGALLFKFLNAHLIVLDFRLELLERTGRWGG